MAYHQSIVNWFCKRRYALINGIPLKPRGHLIISGEPLSVQRGQAESYFLTDQQGRQWVLKILLPGKLTGQRHLNGISSLLPADPAFRCGTARQILSDHSLTRKLGYFYSKDLAHDLNQAILMPKVEGYDWNALISRLRDGSLQWSSDHRRVMCQTLIRIVQQLESHNISHRDLSGGNVFIANNEIALIDFDSLYHSSLTLPPSTTMGTEGYIAPFVRNVQTTWCCHADRFALAILCVEFLLIEPHAPLGPEGGLFTQSDLDQRAGASIRYAVDALKVRYPDAGILFQQALFSNSFADCPSPDTWLSCFDAGGRTMPPVHPDRVEIPDLPSNLPVPISVIIATPSAPLVALPPEPPDFHSPVPPNTPSVEAPPQWSLDDIPPVSLNLPTSPPAPSYEMPDNPWKE